MATIGNGNKLIKLYSCIIGSIAYGLNTLESDNDIREVLISSDLSYYFGTNVFEQNSSIIAGEDYVGWNLKKFLVMASKGNTQALEMLYSAEDCQRFVHPIFKHYVLDEKEQFMTQSIFNSIHGYAISEHNKALGLSSRDLGARRKEDLETLGYSNRNASHCIRLMFAGAHAMLNAEFPVRLPEPERTICLDIKQGKVSKEGYLELYDHYLHKLKEAGEKTTLPTEFNCEWMNRTLVDIHLYVLGLRPE